MLRSLEVDKVLLHCVAGSVDAKTDHQFGALPKQASGAIHNECIRQNLLGRDDTGARTIVLRQRTALSGFTRSTAKLDCGHR